MDGRTLFGVAGNPPNFWASPFRTDRSEAPAWLASIGLDALEIQCTYGVRMPPERIGRFRQSARDHGIALSIHAPYYIVLGSSDTEKSANSLNELSKAVRLAKGVGADRVIFHLGSDYGDRPRSIRNAIEALKRFEHDNDLTDVKLFPEVGGKNGQLGSLVDLLDICGNLQNAFPCLDFAHLHAREGEYLGTADDFHAVFESIEARLGADALEHTHIHMYPVDWGPGGEISHKAFSDTRDGAGQLHLYADNEQRYLPRYEPLMNCLVDRGLTPTVICEAKDSQDVGALEMKLHYSKLLAHAVERHV